MTGGLSIPAVLRVLSWLFLGTAAGMVPPTLISVSDGLVVPWSLALSVTIVVGLSLRWGTPPAGRLDRRTGLVAVAVGWLGVVLLGALPYLFTDVLGGVAALFESASGFTTTGATAFGNVEILPASILMWRGISQWLGGLGVLVLGVAILPFVGVGGAQLFHSEAAGISTERFTLRVASMARRIWAIYAGLTMACLITYKVLGLSWFDALAHALTASATGGFSTRNGSFAVFSPAVQWATIVFMLLAATNFALHHKVLTGRFRTALRDGEWRAAAIVVAIASVICFVALAEATDAPATDTFRNAVFGVTAVLTTAGFHTTDFAAWPVVCLVILLALMFVGAMGGSTGGGFKMVRVVVLTRHTLDAFKRILHPNAVVVSRFGERAVTPDIILNIVGLFALYATAHGTGTILLTALGYDFVTATSAALAAISNVGPALGAAGPTSDYSVFNGAAQGVLITLMLLGRLEFYAILILFVPATWAGARRTLPVTARGLAATEKEELAKARLTTTQVEGVAAAGLPGDRPSEVSFVKPPTDLEP